MKQAVVFEASRTGYELDQVRRPITVGELRDFLDQYEDDVLFFLSHDNGYTYGSISTSEEFDATYDEDEDEWTIERY